MRFKNTLAAALTAFTAVTVPLIGLQDETSSDKPKEPETLAVGDLRARAELTAKEDERSLLVHFENPTDTDRRLDCELLLSMLPAQDGGSWTSRVEPRPRTIQTRAVNETVPAGKGFTVVVSLPEGLRPGSLDDESQALYILTLAKDTEVGLMLARFRGRIEASQVK
jgi:hypothetical protein